MIGFLLVRSVGEALDELAALVSLYSHPARDPRGAPLARQGRAAGDPADVRRLLAPPWLPYRHGLDFLGDLVAAADQPGPGRGRAPSRRGRPRPAPRRRRAGRRSRPTRTRSARTPASSPGSSPTRWRSCCRSVVVLALVGARSAFGHARRRWPLAGARRRRRLVASVRRVLAPAGPGHAPCPRRRTSCRSRCSPPCSAAARRPRWPRSSCWPCPLALWGAWRFLRVVGRLVAPAGAPRWLLLWGAVTYALVPVVERRLG